MLNLKTAILQLKIIKVNRKKERNLTIQLSFSKLI